MDRSSILAGLQSADRREGHIIRVGAWSLRADRVYRRGCPGPAWSRLYYARRDGAQYEIGGWTSRLEAARVIVRIEAESR